MQVFASRVSQLKHLKRLLAVSVFLVVPAVVGVQGQTTEVRLSVVSLAPARVKVEIQVTARTDWSFGNTYGRIVGLAERVENFEGIDSVGRDVAVRKLAPGEFRSNEKLARVSYEVKLSVPARLADMSHVSWLNQEHGLLMLGDLLPQLGTESAKPGSLNLTLILPPGWTSASSIDPIENERYRVTNPQSAVFAVGDSLSGKTTRVGATQIKVVTTGGWAFKDGEAIRIAGKVTKEYARILQHPLPRDSALMLVPFPGADGPDRWSAETRGSTVVVLMGKRAPRGALLGRLKVVLTHELFHLWVPNALALAGEYDWFFEGFTLYQALLTALRLHYITFEDYLETLGRVYNSYRSSPERDKLSLIEASERRWTTSTSLVYDKGMLVAFIYDLMLRRASRGKAMVSDVYPELFRASVANRQGANDLVMLILNRPNGMNRFAEQFIQSAGGIDLAKVLAPFGLDVQTPGSTTRIKVNKSVSPEQRQLLKSLGSK